MFRFMLPAAFALTLVFSAPVFAQSNTAPVDTPGSISAPAVGQVMRSSGPPAASDPGYSGYSGGEAPAAAAPAPAPAAAAPAQPMAPVGAPADPAVAQAPPALPAGTAPAPLNPALNPQPPLPAATIDTVAVDPCKDFMTSNAAYVACQDRIKKYQRMKDAAAARHKSFEAPPKEEKKPEEKKAEAAPAAGATSGTGALPAGAGLNAGTPATPPPAGTKVEATTTEKK